MTESLIPAAFLFRLAVPCYRFDGKWTASGAALDERYVITSFDAELNQGPRFAELRLLSGITDDPLILGSWFELKTDAANVPSRVIHAPSYLGEKPGTFLCLNFERLHSSEITTKDQAAPIFGDILG